MGFFKNTSIKAGLFALAITPWLNIQPIYAMDAFQRIITLGRAVTDAHYTRESIIDTVQLYRLAHLWQTKIRAQFPYELNDYDNAQISCPTLEELAVYKQYKSYYQDNPMYENIPGIVLKLISKKQPEISKMAKFLHVRYQTKDIFIQKGNMLGSLMKKVVYLRSFLEDAPPQPELDEMLRDTCKLIGREDLMETEINGMDLSRADHLKTEAIEAFLKKHRHNPQYKDYVTLGKTFAQDPQQKNSYIAKALTKSVFIPPQTYEQLIGSCIDLLQTSEPKKSASRQSKQRPPHSKTTNQTTASCVEPRVPAVMPVPQITWADPKILAEMLNNNFKVQDNSMLISASDLVIEFGYKGNSEITDRIICLQNDALESPLAKPFTYHERVQHKRQQFLERGLRDEDTVLHTFPEALMRMKHQCIKSTHTDNKNREIENWVFYGQKRINQQMLTGLYVLGFLPGHGKRTCYHSFFIQKDLDSIKNNPTTELLTPGEYQQLSLGLDAIETLS